ncbi:TIGR01244 family sulfur transferase [Devosia sp. ZB163]|uniref:TIGR01244 family sulfur transferase n=1 Tax=Devosia sp. ZB163 TaxID=3025938 RepID=UPI00235E286D|nr:TIGR01244 family sulfur transferase [Devosia sp. ZB163]MDC9823688.1 TIGR01244 family sulfur transferase [Devosia sp. ZB163]
MINKIDDRFSIAPQIRPEDVAGLADAGYRGIICARPDGEDAGQPSFADIAAAAAAAGLKAIHIPVSGMLGEGQLIRMQQALAEIEGPILGYCRSGGRAGSLYQALL